jgi:hypothetical protein
MAARINVDFVLKSAAFTIQSSFPVWLATLGLRSTPVMVAICIRVAYWAAKVLSFVVGCATVLEFVWRVGLIFRD